MSLAALIAANLVPLVGVLFLGWNVATILILYWLENGVVGLINIPKILFAAGRPKTVTEASLGKAGNVLYAAFFVVHYGIFWVGHGVFVFAFTGLFASQGFPDPVRSITGEPGLFIAALGLLLGHAADLLVNYFGRGEYRIVTASRQMAQPYPRMLVLHLTIVLGGLAIGVIGQPIALVALLVVGKTLLDVSLFLRQRQQVVTANADRTVAI